jgi:hypothetical protein
MATPVDSEQTRETESTRATVAQRRGLTLSMHRSHVLKVWGGLSRHDQQNQVKRF